MLIEEDWVVFIACKSLHLPFYFRRHGAFTIFFSKVIDMPSIWAGLEVFGILAENQKGGSFLHTHNLLQESFS